MTPSIRYFPATTSPMAQSSALSGTSSGANSCAAAPDAVAETVADAEVADALRSTGNESVPFGEPFPLSKVEYRDSTVGQGTNEYAPM